MRQIIVLKRGIALVMAMVILALISLLSTIFFYEASLENRTISNYRSSFIARSTVKSLFKAMLVALAQDERQLFMGMAQIQKLAGTKNTSILHPPLDLIALPQGVIPDIDDAIVYTPYIRPIDHLFNLNRIQPETGMNSDAPQDRYNFNEFYNIMRQIPILIETKVKQKRTRLLSFKEITQIYAAIFDWIDQGDDGTSYQSEIGVTGIEGAGYINFQADPHLSIKNRRFDRLSEIRLIKGVTESKVPDEAWQKHFTVYGVGNIDQSKDGQPRININLATESEIVAFMKRYNLSSDLNQKYSYFLNDTNLFIKSVHVDNAEKIAAALLQKNSEGQRPYYTKQREIDRITNNAQMPRLLNVFIFHSEWYEIRLIAEAEGIQAEVQAIVHVPRSENGLADFNKIKIKDFILR